MTDRLQEKLLRELIPPVALDARALSVYLEVLGLYGGASTWPRAVPDAVAPYVVTRGPASSHLLVDLKDVLRGICLLAWSKETAAPVQCRAPKDHPCEQGYGQGSVTALFLRDLLKGGVIVRSADVPPYGAHFCVQLATEQHMDLTKMDEAWGIIWTFGHVAGMERDSLLASEWSRFSKLKERYALFTERVQYAAAALALVTVEEMGRLVGKPTPAVTTPLPM